MINILMVGLGGFLGSICRYLATLLSVRLLSFDLLPVGTLFVNITGCLAIGFLGGLSEARAIFTAETRSLVMVGFLGGFTTFSTFMYENHLQIKSQNYLASFGYITLSIFWGFGAVFLALWLVKQVNFD